MQVGEMQLEVELVAEQVLTEGAPEHWLNGVLGHGMYPQPVDIRVAVLTVGALVHLGEKRKQVLAGVERWQVTVWHASPAHHHTWPTFLRTRSPSHALHAGDGLPGDPKADHSWFNARAR